MNEAQVYLVTGGCGFIGEHIVELLSKQDYVSEVRVFDVAASVEVKKFTTATTHVTVMKGDIRDYNLLLAAMRGVHVVIHTAATVDYRNTVPFWEMKAVNVGEPWQFLMEPGCRLPAHSLLLLIYRRGTEDTKYSGEVELPYGKTKAMAEKLILEANGRKVKRNSPLNGGKLATCIIRPNTIYGEKQTVLKHLYLHVKAKNGVLNYLEPEDSERNSTYVGNVAWMHVLAARSLPLQPDLLAGQVYYAYDDTPTKKSFLVRYQLLLGMDPAIRLGSHVPYWKMWLLIHIYRIIKTLLSPFGKLPPFLDLSLLNTIATTFSYETDKAFRHFGYKPLYSWEESKFRTIEWLKSATGN
uniref:Hydroxy-delta-5-steroid dehydrogenase, 3 beta- and steroid delta-isomerase 7 n=1 Tax=Crocodylus porosus TaxID=8502 RepID=A0A7M4EGC9_CROPO